MKNVITMICMAAMPLAVLNQDNNIYEKKEFARNGSVLKYRILYPRGYNKRKPTAVITFLHGSGERGSDNEAQLVHGGKLFTSDTFRSRHQAIVIFPQCPKDSVWSYVTSTKDTTSMTGRRVNFELSASPTTPALLVKLLLDSLVVSRVADPSAMYLMGLSLGGFGTFDMLERYPRFFTAGVPMAGGGDTSKASRIAGNAAVWIFHGDMDKSVDVNYSRQYYKALQHLGADVQYTEYPGMGHNSWDSAFASKSLMSWLFSKTKKK